MIKLLKTNVAVNIAGKRTPELTVTDILTKRSTKVFKL